MHKASEFFRRNAFIFCAMLTGWTACAAARAADGVFVRFQLTEPAAGAYYVRLRGYIHKSPWYLPRAVVPDRADKQPARRVACGQFTPWFDLQKHAAGRLHGQLHRAGGVAEFPNVTAELVCDPPAERRTVLIELATAPSAGEVIKRFRESFRGSLTSFLVSPDLRADADHLETASEMTERRLRWARAASGGRRMSPKRLIVQTSFWGPQRAELNVKEAEVLHLLGFNVVGNQREEVRAAYDFGVPGHTHRVRFGPAATRGDVDASIEQLAKRFDQPLAPGVPFGFSDEVVCRPPIGDNAQAREHFRQWLAQRKIVPESLGVTDLAQVAPIETPEDFRQRAEEDEAAARRVFYYTSRFRQHAATERIGWHTESFHRHFPSGAVATLLVADHPYFAGSGLGMGMAPNPAWGNYPLALDWFELGRRSRPPARPDGNRDCSAAIDMIGIEDWMGLQFMYGPNWTWEGFQLMGFQAAIFRSASGGRLPIIAWITPSDETNLRLKSSSALCQGAKHFFYWTYGPTATSTENYWSDLRSAYDGIAHMTRTLAQAEHILEPGQTRRTRVALLYSISSDLWQPAGYVHMLERRATYLSLIHDQYLVDLLSEQDIAAGRLADYDVLYATDPCIGEAAMAAIAAWVREGGWLYGSCAAGSRNEFGEPVSGLSRVFGVEATVRVRSQPGRYHIRGALNGMSYLDEIRPQPDGRETPIRRLGAIGAKVAFRPTTSRVVAAFQDGSPAVAAGTFGNGRTIYVGACPGLAYIKEAQFVPAELKEDWPADVRHFINRFAAESGAPRLVELSHPVVEAGVYDAPRGTALVLANFTYRPIRDLQIALPVGRPIESVRSVEQGDLQFDLEKTDAGGPYRYVARWRMPLGLNDVVLCE